MSPGVEGLPPDVDVVPSSETLGLAVVGKVVLVFVADDLGGEGGCQKSAGDAGKWGGLSQQKLVHFELELGGVELLGARTEEALLEGGDDLVLAGEFGLEAGDLRSLLDDLFLKLAEAFEEGRNVRSVAVFH